MIVAQNEKLNKMPVFMKNFVGVIANKAVPQPQPLKLYNEEAAVRIKKAVNIPVILVGGITKIEEIKDLIETEKCDVVSMCRPFIIEPDLVNKFKAKKQTETKCIQCNFCIIAVEEKPLKCYYGKVPKSN
jgi:2,4-dienoyl-CoA reductase-like NADH-dependent reductase (Old Yellow Enzyme family)